MTKMTDERLREILAAYGASPEAWPEEERSEAAKLLNAAPERFASDLAAAETADRVLAFDAVDVAVPAGLVDRVIDRAPERADETARGSWFNRMFGLPGVAAALASLVVGVVVGFQLPAENAGDELIEDQIWADSGNGFEFYDGLSEDG